MRIESVLVLIGVLAGCAPSAVATVSHVRTDGSGAVSMAVGASAKGGSSYTVEEVVVETREDGGSWTEVSDVTSSTAGTGLVDAVLVADNSGSEADYLEDIVDAVDHFAHVLLARSHEDRVGIVRVSTESEVLLELSSDEAEIKTASATMFATNGWTALWDGMRMGNEVLEAGAVESDSSEVCSNPSFPAIVVFTDGQENNSCDEHETEYEGDGVCTTVEDVAALQIHGVTTAIHAVAVGADVDDDTLETLAEDSGGRYVEISSYTGLTGALRSAANRMTEVVPVCFTVEDCDHTEARVTVTATVDGAEEELSYTFELPEGACES